MSESNSNSFIQETSFRSSYSANTSNTSYTESRGDLPESHESNVIMAVEAKQNTVGCAVYLKDIKHMSCYIDTSFQSHDIMGEFSAFFNHCMKISQNVIFFYILMSRPMLK